MQPDFLKTCFFQQPRLASGIVQLLFSGLCVSFLFIFPTRLASGIVQLLFSGLCMSFLFIFPTRPEAAKNARRETRRPH